ncbi:glycoside hydrolase family 2 protein [Maribellus sediminis]|uniref:glycoside hydrolase family 2 protein n=1 Tax=Maribellus sediminis TaxID=2696285 RepID=UPI0014309F51|nr:sugar-binding domain-containing protein [Maribellus sediminis]
MKNIILLALLALALFSCSTREKSSEIDMAGEWRFALDSADAGITEKWFSKHLEDTLHLPGSCLEQGFGEIPSMESKWTVGKGYAEKIEKIPHFKPYMEKDGEFRHPFWWTPDRVYQGAGWYQRDVTIPENWKDQKIVLNLERVHWESKLWIDDQYVGMENGMGVQHEYDLSKYLTPGKHKISLCVDNRIKDVNIGPDGHAISDQTQSNWHGIVGKINLTAAPPVGIDHIRVDARDYIDKVALVQFTVRNKTDKPAKVKIDYSAATTFGEKYKAPDQSITETIAAGTIKVVEAKYSLGENAPLWNEFDPAIFTINAKLKTENFTDNQSTTFGIRTIEAKGNHLLVNGRKIFLRGTLDCCIFPNTGYPPTDKESWDRIFKIVKEHGLNHVRYHSWTPPKAAYEAADEAGVYLQPEFVMWIRFGEGQPIDQWIIDEADRTFKYYGNHPCFALFSIGNENSNGGMEYMDSTIQRFQRIDPRRLYLDNTRDNFSEYCDFNIKGQKFLYRKTYGVCSNNTDYDRNDFFSQQNRPEITHEDGQWSSWPNMGTLNKYKGSLHPYYLKIYRDLMKEAGVWERYDDYYMASGKLQTLLYKATVETALKAPDHSGVQLLDLRDFPGQGFAPVGILDPFWDSKGYCTPEEYRSFCDETVPLARFKSYVWNSDQTFQSTVVVANYGPADLKSQKVNWQLTDATGKVIGDGQFTHDLPTGTVTEVGLIQLPLAPVENASQVKLELVLPGTRFKNHWPLWIYPSQNKPEPTNVLVTNKLDNAAKEALKRGGSVLLALPASSISCNTNGAFAPIFWTKVMFMTAPVHTVGTYCQADHPVFDEFPTENFADWQWYDLLENSKPMIMKELPGELRPMIEPIDDWNKPRKLGSLFEAKVGNGKLLVCSIDISENLEERPAARQFRQSLLSYMSSEKFDPAVSVELNNLEQAIKYVEN